MLGVNGESMRQLANSFDWKLFFRHMLGCLLIVSMWVVQAILRHDFNGVTFALLTGISMAAICYFWVRSDSNGVDVHKKLGNQV